MEALLIVVLAWPLISRIADHARQERALPPLPKLEWHRDPTWLSCCAGAVPFLTLSLGQTIALVAVALVGAVVVVLVTLDEGKRRGRRQLIEQFREAEAAKRQKIAQQRWGRHV